MLEKVIKSGSDKKPKLGRMPLDCYIYELNLKIQKTSWLKLDSRNKRPIIR